MPLINLRDIQISYGGPPLLEQVNLQIQEGERVCLVGRNGSGKSTLLKLIAGEIKADSGIIEYQQNLRIAELSQDVPTHIKGLVFSVVAKGLGEIGELLEQYQHAAKQLANETSPQRLAALENLQHKLDANNGWNLKQQVDNVLSRVELDGEADFAALSGGLKRRVLLAKALVCQPDLLLLDEPTNHLDIAAIEWLEGFLQNYSGALLFITHDRTFLQKIATRIVELDRGQLTSWPGNYDLYLSRKQASLAAEATENALFDKKLAQEETWIRQGIKARRTRNEGRVRALEAMREKHRQRRALVGKANLQIQEGERSGKIVIEAEDICYQIADKILVNHFSTTIYRGDKIGLIGPNGIGKTTLLRILLGELTPQQGTIRHGTRLEIAYFDQLRTQIDEEKNILDNVCGGQSHISLNGQSRHAMSYLQDFLFSPQRARTPVKALSGGERNRLLLARLFTKSFNVLVMDEPTNDLDVETLELLEELLINYTGTLLIVSHDRTFLNNVVTSTLVFAGNGVIHEFIGGYFDAMRQYQTIATSAVVTKKEATIAPPPNKTTTKLSYKEQRELNALPEKIATLEAEQQTLHTAMADPKFYQQDRNQITAQTNRLEILEKELASAYERWQYLEELSNPGKTPN